MSDVLWALLIVAVMAAIVFVAIAGLRWVATGFDCDGPGEDEQDRQVREAW